MDEDNVVFHMDEAFKWTERLLWVVSAFALWLLADALIWLLEN